MLFFLIENDFIQKAPTGMLRKESNLMETPQHLTTHGEVSSHVLVQKGARAISTAVSSLNKNGNTSPYAMPLFPNETGLENKPRKGARPTSSSHVARVKAQAQFGAAADKAHQPHSDSRDSSPTAIRPSTAPAPISAETTHVGAMFGTASSGFNRTEVLDVGDEFTDEADRDFEGNDSGKEVA